MDKFWRKNDVKLHNPKAPKQNKEEDKFDKVMNNLKDLSLKFARVEKSQFHRNHRPILHDMSYKRNWKDEKLDIPRLNLIRIHLIHLIEETIW